MRKYSSVPAYGFFFQFGNPIWKNYKEKQAQKQRDQDRDKKSITASPQETYTFYKKYSKILKKYSKSIVKYITKYTKKLR